MRKYTFGQRFRYFFDNTMSKGTIALVAWLGIVSFGVVLFSATLVAIFGIQEGDNPTQGLWEAMWQSVLRTLDAGTMAGDDGYGYRAVMFFVTLGGIFIISTFIGVVSSGLESKIEDLRKGRSMVIEENHVIVLGWSSKIFTLISELSLANKSAGGGVVVVLADKDKVEMEDEIRAHLPNLHKTRVICRSGSPHDVDDLHIVNPHISKSIVIVSPEEGNADSQVIKTILALNNMRTDSQKPYHIVAEIQNFRNLEVAKMVGKEEVELVFVDDITARIMVQASRQTGLSLVYSNLMDYEGVEMYFKQEKTAEGKIYGDCLQMYENSALMGVQHSDGMVDVNPPMDYKILPTDKLLFLAEDDDKLGMSNQRVENVGSVMAQMPVNKKAERSLLLGWNQRAKTIVTEMDNYAAPNSHLYIVTTHDDAKDDIEEALSNLKNINAEFVFADTTSREVLEKINIPSFDYVMLLCYQDKMDLQDADADTLITLLHLRRIFDEAGKRPNVVSEMLDLRNCELAQIARADDYIVSDKLISLLVTQVAESKGLMRVFDSLFSADGSEIYLKPIKNYVVTGIPTNFYTVVEAARRKGETAIGYRVMSDALNADKAFGIHLNPKKSDLVTYTDQDFVIVLAEEQW